MNYTKAKNMIKMSDMRMMYCCCHALIYIYERTIPFS